MHIAVQRTPENKGTDFFSDGLEHYVIWSDDTDPYHTSASDIVKCLLIAEKKGCIPELGDSWKIIWESTGPREDLHKPETAAPLASEEDQCFWCDCVIC